jgi:copper homeostasis protein
MSLPFARADARLARSVCGMKMRREFFLEISVGSVETAAAAELGSADRVELCSALDVGGLTPSAETMRAVRKRVRLPIFSMVRPRGGGFFYSEDEFAEMRREIEIAKKCGMDGVVLGLLKADGRIDVERTRQLGEQARPLPVTFHRAFDECTVDLRKALEDVIKTGATRLLTSGGKRTAPEALDLIGELVRIAGERLIVMPGSGLHTGNIREAVEKTGAYEYHAGLSSVVPKPAENLGAFENEVRKMEAALAACD